MRQQRPAQQIDRRDPKVNHFVAECGLAKTPVSIRLVGVDREDVQLQVDRLVRTFGQLVSMTTPRQSGKGTEWIAYGTILR